jgi:TRAP-type C4-dicarboxylate transport system permease small subunit
VTVQAAVDRVVGGTLAALMGAAVLNVLWQVASRFLLGDPSSFTDEAARFLLIWIGLLGAAHVAGQRRHLAIDLLPGRLGPRGRARLGLAREAVVAVFALGVLVVGGARLVALSLELGQRSPALGLPLGWVYAVLPVSGALVLFHCGCSGAEHRAILRARSGDG